MLLLLPVLLALSTVSLSSGEVDPSSCRPRGNYEGPFDFAAFHDLDDILDYVDFLLGQHSFLRAETIGKSWEGRDLTVVKVHGIEVGCVPRWIRRKNGNLA